MRVIVFDRELHEPLTVVEVPTWLAEQAKRGERVRLLPQRHLDARALTNDSFEEIEEMEVVTLTFERVCRGRSGNVLFWYAYADDPETALLLRCAFLPGQVGEVQRREKAAFFMGLLA